MPSNISNKKGSLELRKVYPYFYFLPIVIAITVISIFPLFRAIQMSFYSYNLLEPAKIGFNGFANFKKLLFEEPLFLKSLGNGVTFTLLSVLFEYILGLVSALLLNSHFVKMKNTFKALIMLPWAVPIAINSLNWRFMLAPDYGAVNQILTSLGFADFRMMSWLTNLNSVMATVIFVNVWRSFPFYTITLLAGLATIPNEQYEAARIDGAGKIARFFYITLPGLKGISTVIITFHIIWTFINFDVIYLLTGGGPLNQTEVLPTLLYKQAFSNFDMGYASAIGVFISLLLIILVGPFYLRNNHSE